MYIKHNETLTKMQFRDPPQKGRDDYTKYAVVSR